MSDRLFSEIIRRARTSRGLDQATLGSRCNPPRSQSAVAQWESGARPLTEATLEVVAEALGLPLRDLLLEGLGTRRREPDRPDDRIFVSMDGGLPTSIAALANDNRDEPLPPHVFETLRQLRPAETCTVDLGAGGIILFRGVAR